MVDLLELALFEGQGSNKAAMVVLMEQLANPRQEVREALAAHKTSGLRGSSGGSAPSAPPFRELQPQRRLTPAEVERLVESRRAGVKVKDLAVAFGMNRKTVSQHLRRQGVDTSYRALTPEQVETARRLYEKEQLNLEQIAQRLEATTSSVRYALVKQGVAMRSRWDYETGPRS